MEMSEAGPDTSDERYIHQFQPEPNQSVSQSVGQPVSQSATRAVVLRISEDFERVLQAALLYKLKSYWLSVQIFQLISSFFSNRQL